MEGIDLSKDQGPNSHSQTGAPGSPDLYSTEIVKVCKLSLLHML